MIVRGKLETKQVKQAASYKTECNHHVHVKTRLLCPDGASCSCFGIITRVAKQNIKTERR